MEFQPIRNDRPGSSELEPFWRYRDSKTGRIDRAYSQQLAELQALLDVSRELGATTELMPLLQKVESTLRQVLDCERVTIFLYDKPTDELYSLVATGEELISFSAKLGIAGEAFQTKSLINIADAYADRRFNPEIDRKTGFRTRNILTFPMRSYDGSMIGVLQALNKRKGSFDSRDERHAADAGMLAGVAIQRQMLLEAYAKKQQMERDLSLARDIQRKLLPKANPDIPGYQIAGWNKPVEMTGGDFYDYIPVGEGRWGILMADVMGHGIGPALIVSECRALVRALALSCCDPVKILTQVNRVLCEDLDFGRFVTTFFGVLDPSDHCLHYLSTGQGPLLHYDQASGTCREIPATTHPLGIVPDFGQQACEPIALQPRDMLVLTTDGFFEWTNPGGEQFGAERLSRLICDYRDSSPEAIIERIYQQALEFGAGVPQADDLTAVIVKRV